MDVSFGTCGLIRPSFDLGKILHDLRETIPSWRNHTFLVGADLEGGHLLLRDIFIAC
jgi:hypothetical protein